MVQLTTVGLSNITDSYQENIQEVAPMQLNIATMIISIILFFVLFFGIGFILNMLLRQTWIMAAIYPLIALYYIADFSVTIYFTNPDKALSDLTAIKVADMVILTAGFLGAICAGVVMRWLRGRGYRMF